MLSALKALLLGGDLALELELPLLLELGVGSKLVLVGSDFVVLVGGVCKLLGELVLLGGDLVVLVQGLVVVLLRPDLLSARSRGPVHRIHLGELGLLLLQLLEVLEVLLDLLPLMLFLLGKHLLLLLDGVGRSKKTHVD